MVGRAAEHRRRTGLRERFAGDRKLFDADGNEDMTPGPVPLALPAADTTEPLVEEMVEEADALPASDSNRTSCHNKIRKTVQTDASRSSGATEVLQSTRDGPS